MSSLAENTAANHLNSRAALRSAVGAQTCSTHRGLRRPGCSSLAAGTGRVHRSRPERSMPNSQLTQFELSVRQAKALPTLGKGRFDGHRLGGSGRTPCSTRGSHTRWCSYATAESPRPRCPPPPPRAGAAAGAGASLLLALAPPPARRSSLRGRRRPSARPLPGAFPPGCGPGRGPAGPAAAPVSGAWGGPVLPGVRHRRRERRRSRKEGGHRAHRERGEAER